ncbi:MAG: hypothetical protein F9K45_05550 [Melioribacteraceae bacterium]|nr:MAG: hypothetical protein F9K45_05550 [Melioribacteraceae bacterium]
MDKPGYVKNSYEEELLKKLRRKLSKYNKEHYIYITRLESHSNFFIQLTDILLGSVIYDFKKSFELITENNSERKEPVVSALRKILRKTNLADNFTVNKPNYFSVGKSGGNKKKASHHPLTTLAYQYWSYKFV